MRGFQFGVTWRNICFNVYMNLTVLCLASQNDNSVGECVERRCYFSLSYSQAIWWLAVRIGASSSYVTSLLYLIHLVRSCFLAASKFAINFHFLINSITAVSFMLMYPWQARERGHLMYFIWIRVKGCMEALKARYGGESFDKTLDRVPISLDMSIFPMYLALSIDII